MKSEVELMKTKHLQRRLTLRILLHIQQQKHTGSVFLSLLLCLCMLQATPGRAHEIPEITPEMFFQPIPYRADVVLDAGSLGRYRFSEDTDTHQLPDDVTIRRELLDLLNGFQKELDRPLLLISGYRSAQHQIYLWAKWLQEHPAKRRALNARGYKSWKKWTTMSQRLDEVYRLSSKHQTGDAVSFYWEGLKDASATEQARFAERIRKLGGNRRYTLKEREKFNIPANDNARFKVTSYRQGEDTNIDNPSGRAYFHVEYQPSAVPEIPEAADIGKRVGGSEPEQHQHPYEKDDILLIKAEDAYYLGRVMEDAHTTDTKIEIWIFVNEIRTELGTEVPIAKVVRKRERPKEGWGKKEIALEYRNGKRWRFDWNAKVFSDHYRLTDPTERRLEFNQVRIPIPQPR